MNMKSYRWLNGFAVLLSMELHAGELGFARYFTDNMVIQRDQPVLVKGFADKGAQVSVSFAGQTKMATAEDGSWAVVLDPVPPTDKPQSLSAVSSTGNLKAELRNVVVGDVVLFARQTSIDISLGRDEAGRKAALADRHDPRFRAISIKTIPEARPQRDLAPESTSGWTVMSRDSALKMSAAAYYLGRDMAADGGVPVGVIDLNLGSAFAISWLSREALEETERLYGKSDVPAQLSRFDKLISPVAKGEPAPKGEVVCSNFVSYAIFPAGGYNAVINPLKGTALKAVIVELGNDYPFMIYAQLEKDGLGTHRDELNRAYVQTYDLRKNGFRMEPVTVPRIPRVWRDALGGKDLPVGLIMPPGSDLNTLGQHHREMRELHRLTALENQGVGVILPGSGNIPLSGQPDDEALLAKRCLSWVDGAVYRKAGVPATGPLFDRFEGNFNEAVISFKEGTAKGLQANGDALGYFEAADGEGEYSPVKATIDGEDIRIKSDTVPRIVRVRYNWNSRPNQGLVNAAGLPAIPFRSEKAEYKWFIGDEDSDLPEEYHTPANLWKKNDLTLVNGQLKTFGYNHFAGWLGPVGIRVGPFGPNMGVREVKAGSPSEGKILEGDVIYSANGKMLGETAWEVMADAITESETRESGGRLVLGLRRGRGNLDVEVTLEVMGTYSSTAPYDCPKTEKIVADLEKWVVDNGAQAGFLNADALFMLASGNPALQGYVRRIIYKMIATPVPPGPVEPAKSGKSWHNSADAILLGEYYMATGDRNVLPYLKHVCAKISASQDKEEGGWRHDAMGAKSYGMMPNAGLPGVMGMHYAIKAGLDVDRESYALGVKRMEDRRAETGYLIYGSGVCQRDVPEPFNPAVMAAGKMATANGALSAAAILMGFTGNYRGAHLCSLISTYAWNHTYDGHGGNFWNNFWTPLGAYSHGKPAFVEFWRKYRWYRECNRMFDGSLIQHEDGKVGAGTGVVLVAPRKRLQIVGAPASPFETNAPAYLKPALDAYWKKDYAGCVKSVDEIMASGLVGKNDMPTVMVLVRAAREIQESITLDLARMKRLVEEGNMDAARADLAQLKGVMPEGDQRLSPLEQALAAAKPAVAIKAPGKKAPAAGTVRDKRDWVCLVNEEAATPRTRKDKKYDDIITMPDHPNQWRMKMVESLKQAPAGWTSPRFDDAGWTTTTLPISWRLYHTALFRTKFTVKDKRDFDGLRLRAWVYMQQGIEIHINGELVGKINNLEEKTGDIDAEFKESALKCIKDGENTLAVSTRQNWRWGMLFMFVYNDGFDFNLDARINSN